MECEFCKSKLISKSNLNYHKKTNKSCLLLQSHDLSRNIFKFQNSEGELEKDIKANKLTDLIVSSGLKNKTCNIANNLWTKEDGSIDVENFRLFNPHANEIIMIESDNSIFRNELASLTAI